MDPLRPFLGCVFACALVACSAQDDNPESPAPGQPSVKSLGTSPVGRCARVCADASAPACALGPASHEACFDARCGRNEPCAALDALLDCTVVFPAFMCSADGLEVLAPRFSPCQSLYETYVRDAATCSGTGTQ